MVTPCDFLHRFKKQKKNPDMWFLKSQIFQQRYKLKLEFSGVGWGKAKNPQQGNMDIF